MKREGPGMKSSRNALEQKGKMGKEQLTQSERGQGMAWSARFKRDRVWDFLTQEEQIWERPSGHPICGDREAEW